MAIGPGKYDELCSLVRLNANARAALVIVIDGDHGDGFACQADIDTTLRLPEILESVAASIRADKLRGFGPPPRTT